MNILTGKSLSSTELAHRLRQVQKMQKMGDPKFRDYNETVYDDGVWKVDLEMHPYGTIRWWITREDKFGHFNRTQFSMYRAHNELKYSAEFKIKKAVVERLLNAWIMAEKLGVEL